jgi:Mrp family chromosome partitioning ATPase
MATIYEALQRGRQESAPMAPPLPRVSKPHPAMFGAEMRALSSRLQPLFDDRKPVTLAITATGTGEGTSTTARELAYHSVGEGRTVLLCGDPADLDAVRVVGTEIETQTRSMVETSRPGLTVVDIADLHRQDSGVASKVAFRHWLAENSRNFDLVIVDVPPVLDQRSWSGFMGFPDGVVMVVEAERSRSEVIKSTVAAITEASGHVLGLVFTKRRQYIPKSLYKWL